ncbi:PP_RS20740 family protein [Pseudoalteromonas luteoviolacea]|uniref:Uncharacterized protein n=1 Tax=Pseudoalteromonas luteoviolacea S4060-1 TaxID=1365257 RepID=A0A167J198_9GAMM|nr:hypothetical protein [Pseudoalteromonas luteoviolacea]KZN60367.1 hypothetical protein N478_07360 [Pseudoalteromonas luteoviolacea S4060-1]
MADLFGSDDDFFNLEDVTGVVSSNNRNTFTEFKPWHKPRKQFIRDRQWWFHLKRLLTKNGSYKTLELVKYFGLPGGDLLDVYYLGKKFSQDSRLKDKRLVVHGFIDNSADKERAEMRLSKLLDMDCIDGQSKVERYKFDTISNADSVALTKVKEQRGYHFVNLDFCDNIFKQSTVDALRVLLYEQFNSLLDTPWLLCITTRADEKGIAKELFHNLSRIFNEDLGKDDAIYNAIQSSYQVLHESIKNRTMNELSKSELSQVLQLCFIYWVIVYAHDNDSKIDLVSLMNYKVHEGNSFPDMYSYVFRFEKKRSLRPDKLGLATNTNSALSALTENDIIGSKIQAIEKFASCCNVDEVLSECAETMESYIKEKRELLREVGYDVSNYEASCVNR